MKIRFNFEQLYDELELVYKKVLSLKNDILPLSIEALEIINQGYSQGKFSY
jgi:hypothetical protein